MLVRSSNGLISCNNPNLQLKWSDFWGMWVVIRANKDIMAWYTTKEEANKEMNRHFRAVSRGTKAFMFK
jgi:hypothetical protein